MGLLDRFRKQPAPIPEKPPLGASGRGHTAGFLELEEFNADLTHPNGQTVFDKMYRTDGDVRQVVQLAYNPIVSGTWSVDPYGGELAKDEDVKIAEFVRWALWEQMRPNLIGHLIEFLPVLIRAGFTPGEQIWMSAEYEGKTVVIPRTIALRLPRTISQWEQDRFGNLTRIKQYLPTSQRDLTAIEGRGSGDGGSRQSRTNGNTEIWLPASNLVYYRLGAEGDNWEGQSLLRPAYKHWLMKDKIERIDAIAQEREALGVPICYPPLGATTDQLDAVEDILAGMRTNEEGYIVAPGPKAGSGMAPEGQGWLFEVIGYDRTGSGRDPQPSLAYHTQKIAAAFIAEFMRLGHGQTGARATAQVQADPFLMSIEALATTVEAVLNDQLVGRIVAYNFPECKNPPRLRMSLVDSTSLAQLADFVLKLTQIGALLPDQELEDFLRARADLPPANPESVKKRKKEDDELRRQIVMGVPGEGGDKYGQNSKPGVPHGTKDSAGTNPGGAGGTKRGAARDGGARLDSVILSHYDASSDRWRPRDRRFDEMWVDLDGIEDFMDASPVTLGVACGPQVLALARGDKDSMLHLESVTHSVLLESYEFGYQSVIDEAMRQNPDVGADSIMLARGARSRNGALADRARSISKRVALEVEDALAGSDFAHGDQGRAIIAAEKAGRKALERAAYDHGVAAVLHGRHDAGTWLQTKASGFNVTGVRYSAILDRSTCESCREADDGQVRHLDDPVRLHRMPPNPDCHSMHSGHNRCRCFETYEVMPPDGSAATLDGDQIPEFVREVAARLMAGGMDASRAVSQAIQIARTYCRTGKISWPGLKDVGSRESACQAVGISS